MAKPFVTLSVVCDSCGARFDPTDEVALSKTVHHMELHRLPPEDIARKANDCFDPDHVDTQRIARAMNL